MLLLYISSDGDRRFPIASVHFISRNKSNFISMNADVIDRESYRES
jgi:hypothetical protein